jgi:lipopolysaccharide/colanic/teichoic acid biosynthesis glycosyltransferase
MTKRLFDIALAGTLLLATSPLLLLAAIGIKLSSRGPVIYRAQRVGRGGKTFTMFKLRTMTVSADRGSPISAPSDSRVFLLGKLLRSASVDELPQFVNILLGDMSFVGPRPEAPSIVREHYTPWMHETLAVRPGLTSPGALYYYTHGYRLHDSSDPEHSYVSQLLGPKLALDRTYIEEAGVAKDLALIGRTVMVIAQRAIGRRVFPLPPETPRARRWSDVPRC